MITRRKVSMFVVTAVLVYYYIRYGARKRASEALQEVFDYADKLKLLEEKLDNLLSQDKYISLVNNNVKAATDEIGSIRKQTDIYLNMQRIPGGPQNFMETAQAKLDKIHADLFSWEKQYRVTSALLARQWESISKEITTCKSQLKYIHELQHSMAPLRIYIAPAAGDKEPEPKKPKPLQRILELMRNKVLPLAKQYEEHKIQNSQEPYFDESDIQNSNLFLILQNIQTVVDKYSEHFDRVFGLIVQKLNGIRTKTHDIQIMDRAKERYEVLAVQVDLDIIALTERIKSLKYAKNEKDEF